MNTISFTDIIVSLSAFSIMGFLLILFGRWQKKKMHKQLKSGPPEKRVLYAVGRYVSPCAGQIAREIGLPSEKVLVILKELEEVGKVQRIPEEETHPEEQIGWRLNLNYWKQ